MNNHQGKASTPINLRALELIREAFGNSSLTQEQLAQGTGIPRSTLGNFLSQTAEPRLVNVEWFSRIAVALSVDAGDWMDELEAVARRSIQDGDELAAKRATKPTARRPQVPGVAQKASRKQPKSRPGE